MGNPVPSTEKKLRKGLETIPKGSTLIIDILVEAPYPQNCGDDIVRT
jgi:hypothetical protein